MLNIESLSNFRSHVESTKEIREALIGQDLSSFCYMISGEDTFATPELRECRGIVFNTTDESVVSRPLHKFFNVGERESTRVENVDWSKVVRVMDKRDGSMIHTVKTSDGFRLKSKKSFTSDVAIAATKWINSPAGIDTYRLCEMMVDNNFTVIFEWTSPSARIVLNYPESQLQLLHVRDNVTGEYMPVTQGLFNTLFLGVKVVDEVDEFFVDGQFKIELIMEAAKTREGVEGWIVQFEDGEMVKIKTEWYLIRHRAMTFLRERDIAQLVLDEGLDDLKSILIGDGVDISKILEIEARVVNHFNTLSKEVEDTVAKSATLERKDFAIKHNGHPHFGLLMHRFVGKTPNYKEYFERHILREQYSLDTITMNQITEK